MLRVFLDRLADCFAWTKHPEETAEHVTATAILRDSQEQKVTFLIAKNVLHPPLEDAFAEEFFSWLNSPVHKSSSSRSASARDSNDKNFWDFLVATNRMRLEHYITQICEVSATVSRKQEDWYLTNKLIYMCQDYNRQLEKSIQQLGACAKSALDSRRDLFFRSFRNQQVYRREENALYKHFPADVYSRTAEEKLLESIEHLARLRSGYEYFIAFREAERDTRFEYEIIRQEQVKWNGAHCKAKISTWPSLPRRDMVENFIDDAVKKYGDKGSVHCEMQLLCYFIQNDLNLPDYIGCSKKACALYQHVLVACGVHANDQHNFIYPRWSLPSMDFKEWTHNIAAGLMSAHTSMMSVIQESVRSKNPPGKDQGMMHTSARITRRISFSQDDENNVNLENGSAGSHGLKVYSVSDRRSRGSVPAIHFPAFKGAKPRVVRMHFYEMNLKDHIEISMGSSMFNDSDTRLVTAVQLRDKFVPEAAAHTFQEFSKCHWLKTPIWVRSSGRETKPELVIMFRISKELHENSCLWDIIDRNRQNEKSFLSSFRVLYPSIGRDYTRGEVFILPEIDSRPADIAFDLDEVLRHLNWDTTAEIVLKAWQSELTNCWGDIIQDRRDAHQHLR
ncbi:hypothetical protein F5B21DRAFT_473388 [Xylaria acuta]|nr:hypothetical protein F5B21DRAFT_473388 [Xylaria acuta]